MYQHDMPCLVIKGLSVQLTIPHELEYISQFTCPTYLIPS